MPHLLKKGVWSELCSTQALREPKETFPFAFKYLHTYSINYVACRVRGVLPLCQLTGTTAPESSASSTEDGELCGRAEDKRRQDIRAEDSLWPFHQENMVDRSSRSHRDVFGGLHEVMHVAPLALGCGSSCSAVGSGGDSRGGQRTDELQKHSGDTEL